MSIVPKLDELFFVSCKPCWPCLVSLSPPFAGCADSAAFALLLGYLRVEFRAALALLLQCVGLDFGYSLERAACSLPSSKAGQGKGCRVSTASERWGQPSEARPARSARNQEKLILALLLECQRVELCPYFRGGGLLLPFCWNVSGWNSGAFFGRRPPRCHHFREPL